MRFSYKNHLDWCMLLLILMMKRCSSYLLYQLLYNTEICNCIYYVYQPVSYLDLSLDFSHDPMIVGNESKLGPIRTEELRSSSAFLGFKELMVVDDPHFQVSKIQDSFQNNLFIINVIFYILFPL